MDPVRGKLLVASPALIDPNFHRAVVLVAEHTDEGAMGVVLNRPTETTVAEAVPDLAGLVGADAEILEGGPVAQTGIIVLAELDDPRYLAARIEGDLGFVALEAEVGEIAGSVRRARAFAGHAGWGPGQLDAELEEESWIVAPFRREDAFAVQAGDLWSVVLRRMGGRYALLARMPLDPSLN